MQMKSFSFFSTVAFVAVAGTANAASLSVEEILFQYNAVTSGDLYSSQEVEGRVFVNGDLSGSTIQTGFVQPLPAGTDANVVVLGDSTIGTITGQIGKIYINGDAKTNFERQGGGPLEVFVGGTHEGLDNFGIVTDDLGDLSSLAPEIDFGDVANYSTYLSTLTGSAVTGNAFNVLNNAVQSEGSDWDASKVTVYNVSFDDIDNYGSFTTDLVPGSDETIIINVSGTSGTFAMNPNPNYAVAANIIWNFYEATSVEIATKAIGSILAPNATLSSFAGSTEGSVIANDINLNNGELHLQAFVGDLPTEVTDPAPNPVPLPAGLPLTIGAFGLLGGLRVLRKNA